MAISHQPTRRRLNFWRMSLKGGLLLILFVGLVVYSARIPDQYACLQLFAGFGGRGSNLDLIDLRTGMNMQDPRSQPGPQGIPSPDGKLLAAIQAVPGTSTRDLVVQELDDQGNPSKSTIVQKDFVDGSNGFNFFR